MLANKKAGKSRLLPQLSGNTTVTALYWIHYHWPITTWERLGIMFDAYFGAMCRSSKAVWLPVKDTERTVWGARRVWAEWLLPLGKADCLRTSASWHPATNRIPSLSHGPRGHDDELNRNIIKKDLHNIHYRCIIMQVPLLPHESK